jgi:DNA-binding response OmpR family regulator
LKGLFFSRLKGGRSEACGKTVQKLAARCLLVPRWPMARILVVDDEANHVRVLAIGLRLDGFDVVSAHDAVEALEVLRDEPCDLAIVDLMMPGTNGIQLARHMRERYPEVRVILTSAYHLSEHQLLRADCGAVGFVPKPYKLTDLTAFLRSKVPEASGVTRSPRFRQSAAG